MNLKKTQVMFNEQIDGKPEVKIDQTSLKIANSYIYLEQLITILDGKLSDELAAHSRAKFQHPLNAEFTTNV